MMTFDGTVISNRAIARDIFEVKVQTTEAFARQSEPGQFVHVAVDQSLDSLLRRPLSICDIDMENQSLTLIYRAEGTGTKRLSEQPAGAIVNVLGPLGNGFPLNACSAGSRALLVGGGVGVPPLYYLSKRLQEKGVSTTHILGFSDADVVFYQEAFAAINSTYVATVDGSTGQKGFVTDVMVREQLDYDVIYACGPIPMLKALETSTVPTFLSLEKRMGCAIGACYACVCPTKADGDPATDYKKVCSDGPVFKAGEVVLS